MDAYKWVYIQDDWKKVKYLYKENDAYVILFNNKERRVTCVETVNEESLENVDNLMEVPHLNEPELLQAVHMRYLKKNIYTYTGKILISINPFEPTSLYSDQMMQKYMLKSSLLSPHAYQIADNAYRALTRFKQNQSILVSGESGAGKTYTTKVIMGYIAHLSGLGDHIEKKVIECNPILEAFGNAKTLRNDNSSRFGKFIKILFDQSYRLVGAQIEVYLLEKTRIISQAEGERNFHIFYQLLAGLNDKQLKCYQLQRILNEHDNTEYLQTRRAFLVMGFSEKEITRIIEIVVAIIHCKRPNFDISFVGRLLDISPNLIETALYKRNIQAGQESYVLHLNDDQQENARHSFLMALYNRLFNYIVKKINFHLCREGEYFIGILDIFGFESFEKNQFEQFCINYTNESLQQQFNQHIFTLEQIEYEKEGIDWHTIEFPDNALCLDMIEGKMGIIDRLDEECRIPNGNDKNFTSKLLKGYSPNYLLEIKKARTTKFGIAHYAGEVIYTTKQFCEKNKDIISSEINTCLNAFDIFQTSNTRVSRIGSKTVIIQFRKQLAQLMNIIGKTDPHYIRCIKPNDKNIANCFERLRVNEQLKYSGILAAINVSRAGFPVRLLFSEFTSHFHVIKECREIRSANFLSNISNETYRIGKTKIFLKNESYEYLEEQKQTIIIASVICLQKNIRCYFERKNYLKLRHYSIYIQACVRRCLQIMRYQNIRKNIIKIQTCFRRFVAVKKYHRQLSCIVIQKNVRWYFLCKTFKAMRCAAKRIQKIWFAYSFRREKTDEYKKIRQQIRWIIDSVILEKVYHIEFERRLEKFERREMLREEQQQRMYEKHFREERERIRRWEEAQEAMRRLEQENIESNEIITELQKDIVLFRQDASKKISLYEKLENMSSENHRMKQELERLKNKNKRFSIKKFIYDLFNPLNI